MGWNRHRSLHRSVSKATALLGALCLPPLLLHRVHTTFAAPMRRREVCNSFTAGIAASGTLSQLASRSWAANASGEELAARALTLRSGARMPLVGLGTWEAEPGEVGSAVTAALDAGYRHIDCAAVYANEQEVGEALSASSVPRKDLFVTSKLWNDRRRPQDVREALEQTLKDLQTDYVDLYLIHWPVVWARNSVMKPDAVASIREAWQTLETLVQEGKARHIGVSNFGVADIQEVLSYARIPPAVNQVELHPRLPQNDLIAFCKMNGIQVTAYSPLGRGALRGARLLDNPVVQGIAQAHNVPPAAVVLRWNIQRGVAVIPKSVSPKRIRANVDLWGFSLDPQEMANLGSLSDGARFCDAPWSTFPDSSVQHRLASVAFTALASIVFSVVSIDFTARNRQAAA